MEILFLNDNEASLPLSDVFPDVPAAAWRPYQERYPGGFTDPEHILAHFEWYLLPSQGQTILMDTGLGGSLSNHHSVEAMTGGVEGRLLEDLDGAGVSPEDINTLLFSHLHFDHVGWNITHGPGDASRATIRNARCVAHQADGEVCQRPEVLKSFPPHWDLAPAPCWTSEC